MIRYSREHMLAAIPELEQALEQEKELEKERGRKRQEARERLESGVQADSGHAWRYAQAALQEEHDLVATAKPGERNHVLNRAAYNLGQFVGTGALDQNEVEDALMAAADTCGLDKREIPKTIASGLKAGMKEPRVIPEPKKARNFNVRQKATEKAKDGENQGQTQESPSDLLTEYGNAWRIYSVLRDRIAYSAGLGWLLYIEARGVWEVEPGTERLRRVVTEALREVLEAERSEIDEKLKEAQRKFQKTKSDRAQAEVKALEDKERKLKSWISSCENHSRINNTLKQAEGVFWQPTSVWDGNLDTFVCANGVLHLSTGELKPHSPYYYATKSAGAAYTPGATHEAFDKVLELLKQEGDRYESIRRAAGALLHSGNPNEKLWILEGDGGTSKGTLITAISAAMGDYAQALDVTSLLESDRRQGKATPRPDLLKLRGARFVYSAQEPPKYAKLDAGVVKGLSGNDSISVRGLYEKSEVTFYPQFKVWIHSNFPLRVDWDDPGFERRLVVWPFNVKPKTPDATIKTALLKDPAARTAVLSWLVEHHKLWLDGGFDLGKSNTVNEATKAYWKGINPFSDFAEECLVFRLDLNTAKKTVKSRYKAWCEQRNWRPLSDRELSKWLSNLDGVESGKTGKGHFWRGVGVWPPDDEESRKAATSSSGDVSDASDVFTDKPYRGDEEEKTVETLGGRGSLTSLTSPEDNLAPAEGEV